MARDANRCHSNRIHYNVASSIAVFFFFFVFSYFLLYACRVSFRIKLIPNQREKSLKATTAWLLQHPQQQQQQQWMTRIHHQAESGKKWRHLKWKVCALASATVWCGSILCWSLSMQRHNNRISTSMPNSHITLSFVATLNVANAFDTSAMP